MRIMAKEKDKSWKSSKTPCLPGSRNISIQAIIASIIDNQFSREMTNHMQDKEIGLVSQVPIRPECTPTKSYCHRRKRSPLSTDQFCLPNKNRFFIFEEELELGSVHTKQAECGEEFHESSDLNRLPQAEIISVDSDSSSETDTKPEFINEADEVSEEYDETNSMSLQNSENSDLNTHLQDSISSSDIEFKPMWLNEADDIWEEDDGVIRKTLIHSDNQTSKTKLKCKCRYCVNIRSNQQKQDYKCSECKEAVSSPSALTQHCMKKHSLIGSFRHRIPFSCKICKFTCNYTNVLSKHMRYHSEERPFECSICDHKTHLKQNLIRHIKTHSKPKQNKKFNCEHCNFESDSSRSFKKHCSVIHSDDLETFRCDLCNFMGKSLKDLYYHLRKVHRKL